MAESPHGAASKSTRPVLAPEGASPALASRPDRVLEEGYNSYEATPAPWWIGVLWLAFFAFAIVYLISNLLE